MGQNWSSCTRRLPYYFDQGTPVNDINDVTSGKIGRDMGLGHFSKLPQRKSKLALSWEYIYNIRCSTEDMQSWKNIIIRVFKLSYIANI